MENTKYTDDIAEDRKIDVSKVDWKTPFNKLSPEQQKLRRAAVYQIRASDPNPVGLSSQEYQDKAVARGSNPIPDDPDDGEDFYDSDEPEDDEFEDGEDTDVSEKKKNSLRQTLAR